MSNVVVWVDPSTCDPPHRVVRDDQVVDLANDFVLVGWRRDLPSLVGYPVNRRIQLLSGTHRHAAACLAGIRVPVVIRPYSDVRDAYGNIAAWSQIMTVPCADGSWRRA